jgi:hypothetical protein
MLIDGNQGVVIVDIYYCCALLDLLILSLIPTFMLGT